jgi:hypothetical protein
MRSLHAPAPERGGYFHQPRNPGLALKVNMVLNNRASCDFPGSKNIGPLIFRRESATYIPASNIAKSCRRSPSPCLIYLILASRTSESCAPFSSTEGVSRPPPRKFRQKTSDAWFSATFYTRHGLRTCFTPERLPFSRLAGPRRKPTVW